MHVTHVNIWKCSKCNSTWHACVRGKHLCMFLTCMLIVPTLQLLSFLFMLVSVTYTVSRYRFRMCTLNVHVAHVNIRNMKHAFLHNMHVWGRTLWCALLAQTTPTSSLHAPEKCMSKEKLHVNKQHACQKKIMHVERKIAFQQRSHFSWCTPPARNRRFIQPENRTRIALCRISDDFCQLFLLSL